MKNILILCLIIISATLGNGQTLERQVIASGGTFEAAGNLSLSFTIGELAVLSLETDVLLLLQGFQQGETATPTGLSFPVRLHFSVHPNPSAGPLTLFLPENAETTLKIGIFNAAGKLLLQQTAPEFSPTVELSLATLPAGSYFILLENTRGERGVAPVIKQ